MKCVCGGPKGHHWPDGCQCSSCAVKPEVDRCTGYEAAPDTARAKAGKSDPAIAKGAKETSVEAAVAAKPNAGSIMRACYDLVEASGKRGMTPAEVEQALGRGHQTVSPRMTELGQNGLIIDSGSRRRTPSGNEAVVYIVMPEEGYVAPTLELDIDELEPEREPDFDVRLVTIANKIAGRFGGDSRKHLAAAKDILSELGLNPGATPEYPAVTMAA